MTALQSCANHGPWRESAATDKAGNKRTVYLARLGANAQLYTQPNRDGHWRGGVAIKGLDSESLAIQRFGLDPLYRQDGDFPGYAPRKPVKGHRDLYWVILGNDFYLWAAKSSISDAGARRVARCIAKQIGLLLPAAKEARP